MKRFTMSIALVAFVAALAAPLAFAQGGQTPATTPSSAPAAAPAEKAPKAMKAMHSEKAAMAKVDINSATKEDLMKLPGVGDAIADKIIAGRPYKSKAELSSKKILGAKAYAKIRSMIVAKQEAAAK